MSLRAVLLIALVAACNAKAPAPAPAATGSGSGSAVGAPDPSAAMVAAVTTTAAGSGVIATDGHFQITLPTKPQIHAMPSGDGASMILAASSDKPRFAVLQLGVSSPGAWSDDPTALQAFGDGILSAMSATATWKPATLAGLPARVADGTYETQGNAWHLRLWTTAAPTQHRYYGVIVMIPPGVSAFSDADEAAFIATFQLTKP